MLLEFMTQRFTQSINNKLVMMKNRVIVILSAFIYVLSANVSAQTTYQYDENGNRTARIIDLGKDLEEKVSAH